MKREGEPTEKIKSLLTEWDNQPQTSKEDIIEWADELWKTRE
jgi:hypothetical protein